MHSRIWDTSFGVHDSWPGRNLFAEIELKALVNNGIPTKEVYELYYDNFIGTLTESQGH